MYLIRTIEEKERQTKMLNIGRPRSFLFRHSLLSYEISEDLDRPHDLEFCCINEPRVLSNVTQRRFRRENGRRVKTMRLKPCPSLSLSPSLSISLLNITCTCTRCDSAVTILSSQLYPERRKRYFSYLLRKKYSGSPC